MDANDPRSQLRMPVKNSDAMACSAHRMDYPEPHHTHGHSGLHISQPAVAPPSAQAHLPRPSLLAVAYASHQGQRAEQLLLSYGLIRQQQVAAAAAAGPSLPAAADHGAAWPCTPRPQIPDLRRSACTEAIPLATAARTPASRPHRPLELLPHPGALELLAARCLP